MGNAGAKLELPSEPVVEAHDAPVTSLAYREGVLIAGSEDRSVSVWNIKTSKLLYELPKQDDAVTMVDMWQTTIATGAAGKMPLLKRKRKKGACDESQMSGILEQHWGWRGVEFERVWRWEMEKWRRKKMSWRNGEMEELEIQDYRKDRSKKKKRKKKKPKEPLY